MASKQKQCKECGKTFLTAPNRPDQDACSVPCGKAFNNRRQTRGAQLFDLMMTDYTNRAHRLRKNGTLQKAARRLLSRWATEDKKAGRAHCNDPSVMLAADMTLTSDAIYSSRNPWG